MMKAIEAINLTKKFKSNIAVDNLNLEVEKGELFGLLGMNGAGKTTTVKMLTCLLKPTAGDAFLLGNSIRNKPYSVKAITNISPQETAVAQNLSVRENLELIARIYGFDKNSAKEKASEMIKSFGLSEIQKNRAKIISGGMQRRLSIAMALISDPEILFLDEPTLGLDVLSRRELWSVLRKLKGNITMMLTTHYMEEAEALCDRIGILADGQLKIVGTAEELISKTGSANFEDAFVSIATEVR